MSVAILQSNTHATTRTECPHATVHFFVVLAVVVNHPSFWVEFLRIRENTWVTVLSVRLERAKGAFGHVNTVDRGAFGGCRSLLRHWNRRIDTESLFDYCIQIR